MCYWGYRYSSRIKTRENPILASDRFSTAQSEFYFEPVARISDDDCPSLPEAVTGSGDIIDPIFRTDGHIYYIRHPANSTLDVQLSP